MQACRFKSTRSPAHSHCSIVQNRFVHNIPHSICKVWAQRSHELRSRFHTALVGTILVPISQIPNGCSFLLHTTCVFLTLMPPEQSFKTKFVVGVVPRRLDPVVHLQSPSWSLFTGDSSERFGESSVPAGFLPQTDTDKQEQQIAQAGETQNHTHTLAARQQTIPSNVFTTEWRRLQDFIPMQRYVPKLICRHQPPLAPRFDTLNLGVSLRAL